MVQITCEAAADTQSQIWVIYIQAFVFLGHVTTVCMDGRSHLSPPPLYMWYFALGVALRDHWPI